MLVVIAFDKVCKELLQIGSWLWFFLVVIACVIAVFLTDSHHCQC